VLNDAVGDVDDVMSVELEEADFRRAPTAADREAGAVAEAGRRAGYDRDVRQAVCRR